MAVPALPMLAGLLDRVARASDALLARVLDGDVAAQLGALAATSHRTWPRPVAPWVQGQTWRDLLFAHWPLPVEALRPAVAAEVPLDLFDGHAWLGIAPFEVTGLRARGLPPIPGLSRFAETNVRTYTTIDGRPGIHFLSLDAASRLAVAGARQAYRLPYFHAHMSIERDAGAISYVSRRDDPAAELRVRYRPSGPVFSPRPGTLEHFLTERYCLYTLDERRRLRRADIHHPPWPLQAAEAAFERNSMTAPYGIALPDTDPLLHFAARQDVLIWPLGRPAEDERYERVTKLT